MSNGSARDNIEETAAIYARAIMERDKRIAVLRTALIGLLDAVDPAEFEDGLEQYFRVPVRNARQALAAK